MAKKKSDMTKATDMDQVINSVKGEFGDTSIMKGDASIVVACNAIPTGSLTLDKALGVFGVPRGRVVELYGPESSGKTTLTLSIIAQAQKDGLTCVFIDAEHALDLVWARKIGVNTDNWYISQPDYGEQALNIVLKLCESGKVGLIVVDSVAALVPRAELEGEIGDSHVGLQARMMSQALRKISGVAKRTETTVIFINQIREKIGVMFGNPEVTPGGRALKFYSSVRMDIRKKGTLKDGDKPVGARTKVKVVKNKVACPFIEAEFDIRFGSPVSGIDEAKSLLELCDEDGIINKSGSWYTYGDLRLGNGTDNASQFLRDNTDLMNELRSMVVKKYKVTGSITADVDDELVDDVLGDENDESEI